MVAPPDGAGVTGCPLTEPGILAAMLAPEPDAERIARPALPTTTAVAARAPAAAALAACIVVAIRHARDELPFGADGAAAWWSVAATGALACAAGLALARRWRPAAFATTVVGCGGAAAIAIAALLASLDPPHRHASWWPLALALGLAVAGAAPRPGVRSGAPVWTWLAIVLAAGAGAAAAGLVVPIGPGAALATGVGLTLLAIAALAVAGAQADQNDARANGAFAHGTPANGPTEDVARRARVRRSTFGARAGAWLATAAVVAAIVWVAPRVPAAPWSQRWLAAIVAVAGLAVAAGARGVVFAAAVAAAVCTWPTLAAAPPRASGGAHERVVAAAGRAYVGYGRATQELRLCVDGALVDAVGPLRCEVPLAATLVRAFAAPGDRVLVAGVGTGRLLERLVADERLVVDAVEPQPVADAVRWHCRAIGPVPDTAPAPPPVVARAASVLAAARALGSGSRQVVVRPPCVIAVGSRTDAELQHELRRVVGDGLVVQPIALDHSPTAAVHALFAAAIAAHPWNGVFVVGDGAVLVSAAAAVDWTRVPPLASWPRDARWCAHRAHLGEVADLQRACLGTLVSVAPPEPGSAAESESERETGTMATGRSAVIALLGAWLVPAADVAASPHGVLRRWQAQQAELRAASARIRALGDDSAACVEARALASRLLHVGAGTPELQAALGLPAADGTTFLVPAAASRRAHALDPTFHHTAPPVCRSLPPPLQTAGELEDRGALPPPARLALLASADDPLAAALRARFSSECAEALVAALAEAPLAAAAARALRELADPFVLREAAAAVASRAGERELLALWRGDLPMPAALAALVPRATDDRRLLAAALRGRTDASCHPVLADLLDADEPEVRRLAGEALASAVGSRVPYDAAWPQSARREAAQRLRSLHNRAP